MARIRSLLTGNKVLLLVNGIGGIGKTTLASHYYHRYASEYAHLIWAVISKDIDAAFAEIAVALELEFSDNISSTEQTILALTELDEPCLLVLDNANDPNDLEASYYGSLRKLSFLHLLITTRVPDLSCAEFLKIEHLNQESALQLFKKFYRQHQVAEDSLLLEILQAVDYHTLTIEIIAKSLAERNRLRQHCSIAQLKQQLMERGVLRLNLNATVSADYKGFLKAKPEDIIASMYDLAELGEEEKRVMYIFSFLPTKSIALEMLEYLLPDNFAELEVAAGGVARKGWVEFERDNSHFRISPVVREIVLQKTEMQHRQFAFGYLSRRDTLDSSMISSKTKEGNIRRLKLSMPPDD